MPARGARRSRRSARGRRRRRRRTPSSPSRSPTPTLCGGNSSRMIPKLSGKIAAPAPWSARNTISVLDVRGERGAERRERRTSPARSPASASCRGRRRACRGSASAPTSSRRKLVTSQVVHSGDVSNSRWKNGSAGTTSVCISANEMPAMVSRASVTLWGFTSFSVPLGRARLPWGNHGEAGCGHPPGSSRPPANERQRANSRDGLKVAAGPADNGTRPPRQGGFVV